MSETENMRHFWDNLPGLLAMGLIFGGGLITGVIAIITKAWKHNRESERLAILKQQMLDRGMSADEIVRVISAGQSGPT